MLKWLAVFLVIWFIHTVRSVFPPFILGGILAYLLLPLVQQIAGSCRMKVPYAVAVLYLSVAGTCFVLGWVFLPTLMDQFGQLASQRHDIITNFLQQLQAAFRWRIDVPAVSGSIEASIEESVARPSGLVHSVSLVSHWLLSLLVCIVSSIYFIVDSERVGQFCLRFIPAQRHTVVKSLSSQMNRMLARYVRGQLVLIAFMSVVAYLFLHFVIHMKYSLAVAITTGFLEIIPVLGPIVATTIATLVGFWHTSDPTVGLGIIGFYAVARWLEDYLVVPKVIGHAVHLHPLVVIFAVLCGEVLAGALGMLIAIPVAASIKVIVDFTHPEEPPLAELLVAPGVEPEPQTEVSGKPQAT